jgi:hypothetical protein
LIVRARLLELLQSTPVKDEVRERIRGYIALDFD